MVYFAGAICWNSYEPLLPAVVLRTWPVSLLVRLTLAPGTRAPLGSLTAPRRDVVAVWADAREKGQRMQMSTQPHRDLFTSVPPKENQARRPKVAALD